MSECTVKLKGVGVNKIGVIKALREITPSLGLKEAKDFLDVMPRNVLENVGALIGETAFQKLKDAGADVELEILNTAPAPTSSASKAATGEVSELERLCAMCFPGKPELPAKLKPFEAQFGLNLGWYMGLIKLGLVQG
jgi:Ribosomal protein L7/L12 C-terminal domain